MPGRSRAGSHTKSATRKQRARRVRLALGAACFCAGLLLALPVVHAGDRSIWNPASPTAESIHSIFLLVIGITGVIFILVQGALLYFVYRFRRRDPDDKTEPPQLYGSRPIELAWTVAPLLTVFVLFLVVVRTVSEIRAAPPSENALRVTVVGHQWWWEFRYPDHGVTTANELHVPVGDDETPRPIVLELESADVIHSFWLPRLAGKTDVIPNHVNMMWFEARTPEVYLGQCAEYCGTQHANMLFRVVAESPADFDAWVEEQRRPAATPESAQAGWQLFRDLACLNCHTIRGTVARGTVGPDLTHLMSRATIASGSVPNDRDNLIEWVYDAQTLKPGCEMPGMKISRAEATTIADYLLTLQ
ncbi:MAG: cytochrome c oxidase subunit II [Pirellulales bacterium]|nr:cytochrome c oxidase subunit II [Pirellulales bacterium]